MQALTGYRLSKTQVNNITIIFDAGFVEVAENLGKDINNINVADSADIIDPLSAKLTASAGNNANPENMNILKTKAVNVQALRAYYNKNK